jgi:hypothetical protein
MAHMVCKAAQRILANRNVGLQSDILLAVCSYFNSSSMLNHLGTLIALTNPTYPEI